MVRIPTHRAPIHPGEILREEFLGPMNVSPRELADAIRVPYQRVNELVNGRRGITPETALRLARYFGTTAGFWMNVQLRCALYKAQLAATRDLALIPRYQERRRRVARRAV
jgi:addiction module HigA family antidote